MLKTPSGTPARRASSPNANADSGVAVAGFFAAMIGGGAIMFLLGFYAHRMALGVAVYVILVIAGAGTFIWAVATKSDPEKPLGEYLAERQRARSTRP